MNIYISKTAVFRFISLVRESFNLLIMSTINKNKVTNYLSADQLKTNNPTNAQKICRTYDPSASQSQLISDRFTTPSPFQTCQKS